MALGLKALGPSGLWESLAGSVLFPGHDHYYHCYFSTHYASMQFRHHEGTHAGSLALPELPASNTTQINHLPSQPEPSLKLRCNSERFGVG